jgi:hypothetical protein
MRKMERLISKSFSSIGQSYEDISEISIQEGEEEDSSFPQTTSEDAECTTNITDNTSRQESTHHRGPINKSRVTLQNSLENSGLDEGDDSNGDENDENIKSIDEEKSTSSKEFDTDLEDSGKSHI